MSKLSSSWTSQMLCRVEELLFTISGVMRSVHGIFFSRSTFVGSLHVLFFKHQVVTLYCSRVKLHPENNLTLWSHLTFMIAFNLQETKQTNVTMNTKAQISQLLKTQFVFFSLPWCPLLGAAQAPAWCIHGLCGLDQCDLNKNNREVCRMEPECGSNYRYLQKAITNSN